jgi:hypothetical protein
MQGRTGRSRAGGCHLSPPSLCPPRTSRRSWRRWAAPVSPPRRTSVSSSAHTVRVQLLLTWCDLQAELDDGTGARRQLHHRPWTLQVCDCDGEEKVTVKCHD